MNGTRSSDSKSRNVPLSGALVDLHTLRDLAAGQTVRDGLEKRHFTKKA
jgi:hypothetical protein